MISRGLGCLAPMRWDWIIQCFRSFRTGAIKQENSAQVWASVVQEWKECIFWFRHWLQSMLIVCFMFAQDCTVGKLLAIPRLLRKGSVCSEFLGGLYMGVSKNVGTPKSSTLIGCSIINHPFWFGNTQKLRWSRRCILDQTLISNTVVGSFRWEQVANGIWKVWRVRIIWILFMGFLRARFTRPLLKQAYNKLFFIDLWNDILSGASEEYEAAPCWFLLTLFSQVFLIPACIKSFFQRWPRVCAVDFIHTWNVCNHKCLYGHLYLYWM